MTMASSKSTEKQIYEGLFSKVLSTVLKGRTETVLNMMKNDPGLTRATKDLIDASNKWKKTLKKSHDNMSKSDKQLMNRLKGL